MPSWHACNSTRTPTTRRESMVRAKLRGGFAITHAIRMTQSVGANLKIATRFKGRDHNVSAKRPDRMPRQDQRSVSFNSIRRFCERASGVSPSAKG